MGGDWKELFAAACSGDLELVSFHVRNDVDVNYAHPEFMSTPLVGCILAGQEPAARYLLDHGADPTLHSDFDGMTPLQAAESMGMTDLAGALRDRGA